MSQYKDIPQPADQRNVSQGDLLTNFRYLSTPINVAAGVPAGILPVDHKATGDNVASPKDGFHLQVSYINQSAAPTTLVNAINSQSSNGISYCIAGAGGAGGMEHFYNGNRDYPKSYVYAMVRFVGSTGAIMGNAFNVTSVTRNGVGSYQVNFTNNFIDTNYLGLFTCESPTSNSNFPIACMRNPAVGTCKITVFDPFPAVDAQIDPLSVSAYFIEYF